jgi:hypothetical protein
MEKGAVKEVLKQGAVKAVRMTESELEDELMHMLGVFRKILSDLSLSEVEEIIAGVFDRWVNVKFGVELLVVRLDGSKGFVFLESPEEFVSFVKKHYGGIERLIKRFI